MSTRHAGERCQDLVGATVSSDAGPAPARSRARRTIRRRRTSPRRCGSTHRHVRNEPITRKSGGSCCARSRSLSTTLPTATKRPSRTAKASAVGRCGRSGRVGVRRPSPRRHRETARQSRPPAPHSKAVRSRHDCMCLPMSGDPGPGCSWFSSAMPVPPLSAVSPTLLPKYGSWRKRADRDGHRVEIRHGADNIDVPGCRLEGQRFTRN